MWRRRDPERTDEPRPRRRDLRHEGDAVGVDSLDDEGRLALWRQVLAPAFLARSRVYQMFEAPDAVCAAAGEAASAAAGLVAGVNAIGGASEAGMFADDDAVRLAAEEAAASRSIARGQAGAGAASGAGGMNGDGAAVLDGESDITGNAGTSTACVALCRSVRDAATTCRFLRAGTNAPFHRRREGNTAARVSVASSCDPCSASAASPSTLPPSRASSGAARRTNRRSVRIERE